MPLSEFEMMKYTALETTKFRKLFKENKHFENKKLMYDLFDDSKLPESKCNPIAVRIGPEYQIEECKLPEGIDFDFN